MRTKAVVYWLYDGSCICYERHGYIGVTVDWPHRLWRHRCDPQSAIFLPADFDGRVIFTGHIKECLALERRLRPGPGIGWNRNPGGLSGHALKGIPKSPEQKAKMRAAALARFADQKERERMRQAVKKAFKTIDRSGENNGRFGKPMSEASKQKIRDTIAARGGRRGDRNANFRHGNYSEEEPR